MSEPAEPRLSSLAEQVRHGDCDAKRVEAADALGFDRHVGRAPRVGGERAREPYSSDVSAAVVRALAVGGPPSTAILAQLYRENRDPAVRSHLKWAMKAAQPRPISIRTRLTQVNLKIYARLFDAPHSVVAGRVDRYRRPLRDRLQLGRPGRHRSRPRLRRIPRQCSPRRRRRGARAGAGWAAAALGLVCARPVDADLGGRRLCHRAAQRDSHGSSNPTAECVV